MRGYQYIGPIAENSWRFGLSRRKRTVVAQRLENGKWKTHGVISNLRKKEDTNNVIPESA